MCPETVSICIVAYNEENYLPNLFHDLNEQTYPHEKIEIVLVDSMSTDTMIVSKIPNRVALTGFPEHLLNTRALLRFRRNWQSKE